MDLSEYDLLQCDIRETPLGEALRVQIHRKDLAPMGWREIWEVFSAVYPGRWACQMFPPAEDVIDQANKYHLFIFDERPRGMDLGSGTPKGATRCAIDYPLVDTTS